MANTNIDLLYPEFWLSAFDELDTGIYNFQNLVSRSAERQLATAGEAVNVPLAYDFGDADDWTPGTAITASDIAQQTKVVTLNQSKRKTFTLNGTDLSKSPYQLIEEYGIGAAKSIFETVNKTIYETMLQSTEFIDGITTFDKDTVLAARKRLAANEASQRMRQFVAGTDEYSDMLGFADFARLDYSGDRDPIIEGRLNRRYGMTMYENNAIETYTPADVVGAVNNVAGYNIGDTTIIVDGFDDDTNPIRVGDIFTIATETGTPYHTVTATTTTGDDTTGITFAPSLVSAIADNDAITVTPTRSAVAFVPSGVAFAARAYAALPEGVGVRTTIQMINNLPIRVSIWQNGSLGINIQYDILYGCTLVKSSRVVRVLVNG